MQWILPTAFIVLPFAFLSPGLIHKGHHYAFFITALFLVASWVFTGIKVEIKNRFLGLFLAYFCGWAIVTFLSAYRKENFPEVALAFYTLFYFMAGAVIFISAASSKLKTETFYNFICVAVIIQAVIALFQIFGLYPIYYILGKFIKITWGGLGKALPRGTLGNPDFLLAYIAISFPLFFRKWWVFSLLLFIPILFIAKVSTAIIAVIVGVAIYFEKNVKWLLAAACPVLMGIILYAAFIDPIPLNNARFEWWAIASSQLDTWPKVIFGLGPGSTWGGRGSLHNEWLSILHTYGVVGLFFVLMGFYQAINKFYFYTHIREDKRHLVAALAAAGINCFGNPALQYAPTLFLILILFGLAQRGKIYG